jgi:hypothetical protein
MVFAEIPADRFFLWPRERKLLLRLLRWLLLRWLQCLVEESAIFLRRARFDRGIRRFLLGVTGTFPLLGGAVLALGWAAALRAGCCRRG